MWICATRSGGTLLTLVGLLPLGQFAGVQSSVRGKGDLLWNARLLTLFTILSPNLWQVQAPRVREIGLSRVP